ncbi:hypothetical protein ACFP2T_37470 [Plantactinospora solaniradicis]|uniref:Uncharacterized protein n=1 Tax=Plantactinospora solaniradicis TaxID=1723736 RepID=A0ABW1KJQ3_9ACTN
MEHNENAKEVIQPAATVHGYQAHEAINPFARLAHDTNGQLRPRFRLVSRAAGKLACGDFVIEPALGPVHVVATEPMSTGPKAAGADVQVRWRDIDGPCTAIGRYPASLMFATSHPAAADICLIERGIAQARHKGGSIKAPIARLIAAHLQWDPQTALYRFAVDGSLNDRLLDELDQVKHRQLPQLRAWVDALACYHLGRDDHGPLPGWKPELARARPLALKVSSRRSAELPPPLRSDLVSSEVALQLVDAAFALGAAARYKDHFSSAYLTRILERWSSRRL